MQETSPRPTGQISRDDLIIAKLDRIAKNVASIKTILALSLSLAVAVLVVMFLNYLTH